MNFARIQFRPLSGIVNDEGVEEIQSLLGDLRRNGNTLGGDRLIRADDKVTAYVTMPEASSLEESNLNSRVEQILERIMKHNEYGHCVLATVADESSPCSCHQSALLVFTTFLTAAPPLCCLDCLGYVPLYRIPPEESLDYSGLLSWEASYQACDTLQMHCRVGEKFGVREMSNLNSKLSKDGRSTCSSIEKRTGKPTYYYLYRAEGRSLRLENERKCPNCGGEWILEENSRLKFIDFRCDRCRLVSNIGFGVR